MKKAILLLALLMGILFSASPATTAASRPTSSVRLSGVEAPAANPKTETAPPRWKKRKIQRQNTVGKTNRRAKKNQRKNGIGMVQLEIRDFA